ncbi:MAG: hypothetical protein IJ506_00630 [Clostridia bacterium]|nr:hypothetical protein [Clostridia bacterium]
MNNEKITITQLLSQLQIVLKDELIAKVQNKSSVLTISFPNGQKFILSVTEEK